MADVGEEVALELVELLALFGSISDEKRGGHRRLAAHSYREGTTRILEVADIRIAPGRQAEFDMALRRGVETVVSRAKGFRGFSIHKGIESPERYLLLIHWDTLENHTVDFRQSALFAEWRRVVGPFFAVPPVVEHFDPVAAPPA